MDEHVHRLMCIMMHPHPQLRVTMRVIMPVFRELWLRCLQKVQKRQTSVVRPLASASSAPSGNAATQVVLSAKQQLVDAAAVCKRACDEAHRAAKVVLQEAQAAARDANVAYQDALKAAESSRAMARHAACRPDGSVEVEQHDAARQSIANETAGPQALVSRRSLGHNGAEDPHAVRQSAKPLRVRDAGQHSKVDSASATAEQPGAPLIAACHAAVPARLMPGLPCRVDMMQQVLDAELARRPPSFLPPGMPWLGCLPWWWKPGYLVRACAPACSTASVPLRC